MIAAAIAKEIGAKFCSVKPSDLLQQGAGNTERAVRTLFKQARKFPCAVIYFDEMDSISPKSTKSQYAKQLRSEFLAQLQGIESYGKDTGNILFLICATNKPWDIDSAFLRPGRFGTKIYVGLPDDGAREYMINKRLTKLINRGVVDVHGDIDVSKVVDATSGFNGADITNFLDKIEEISIIRGIRTGEKFISNADFEKALEEVHSSVQTEDLIKLKEWRAENDS
jgi:SpoVK/Ycf46/Vps4 family AAA+-type ATPase